LIEQAHYFGGEIIDGFAFHIPVSVGLKIKD
jgi:hypothetical protein